MDVKNSTLRYASDVDIKNQTVRYTMCIRSERREANSKINKHYLEVDVEDQSGRYSLI